MNNISILSTISLTLTNNFFQNLIGSTQTNILTFVYVLECNVYKYACACASGTRYMREFYAISSSARDTATEKSDYL